MIQLDFMNAIAIKNETLKYCTNYEFVLHLQILF